jgi:hypothetical protein
MRNSDSPAFPSTSAVVQRCSQDVPWLLILLTVTLALCGLIYGLSCIGLKDLNAEMLLKDPAQIAGLPFYAGFFSNIGILLWTFTASVLFFCWALLKHLGTQTSPDTTFLFMAGVLSAILCWDDLFLIHEEIIPKVLFPKGSWLHIPEHFVYIGYALWGMAFVFLSRTIILSKTRYTLLPVALGLLALSAILDSTGISSFVKQKDLRYLIEDGLKLGGIIVWTTYFVHSAWLLCLSKLQLQSE